MKRRIVPGSILALSVAVVLLAAASTASAATEYHFQLFEKQSFQGWGEKVFRYKGKMFDPQDRDNRVGSDRGKCKLTGGRRNPTDSVRCEGTLHLNGEIGGSGDIEYGGTWRRGDDTFDVVGGSGDFAGATGETGFRNLRRGRPDYERFWPRMMTTWDLVVP
jgi:hypothetical protein